MPVISSRRNVVSIFLRGACAILLTASLSFNLHAQAIYGSIVGTVSDQSGAVAPGVSVTATNAGTGQAKSETTDQSGRYTIQNLQPGTYTIDLDAKGFRRVQQTGIIVTPNTISRADQSLQIGQATEQVNISAAATVLQTDKADTHSEISSKQIREIPLGGQRSYQTLINLTPGSLPASFNNSVTDNPASPLNTHINGGPGQTNTTRIDGASSVNIWLPQYAGYNTSAETVDVVNVVTSAADADQGLAGASSITVVTKSGTNTLHGSAFIFHNDQHLNARNFFLSPAVAKPVGIYNNYGGTLGGPIMKNKLFYFVSFDGTNQKSSANGTYTVPTLDQRNGDFSAYSTLIYDPNTGTPDGKGRIPFPGNKIPAQLISPAALKLQNYYPLPNLQGATNNYAATGGPIVDRDSVDTKINWNRNDRHAIWGKYGRSWATSGGTGIFGVAGGPAPGSDPGKGDTTVQILTIGHTYTISPNLLLDGNIGYQRQVQTVKGNDFGTNFGSVLGIPGLNGPDQRQSGFPDVTFNGYSQFGIPNWMPLFRTDENYTTSTSLSWNKGAHSLRFGFDSVRFHLNHWQPELSNGGPRGALDFNGQVTALNGGAAPTQFNSYAQFLLGYSNEVQKGEQYILMTGREWQFGGYAQDRWQVSRNLTVSLGLRYEYYPLMTRAGKGIERYDPLTNRVLLGGRGGQPDNVGITTSKKLFAPRAGIAYRMGEKTVIRAGYGLNYDPIPFSRPLRGFYPLTINADTVAPNSFSYASTFAAGIPPVVGPDLSSGSVVLPGNASERSPWGGLLHRGYTQTWNFTVERKLPLDLVASAGYVGAHSVHLLADRDINAGAPGSGTAGLPYASYGRTVPTNMWDGYLSSSYSSLQVALNKQFSKGLLLKGAYTWSHAIDYTDDDGWASVGWNYAPVFQRNRATAGFDRNQVFQMGWVYELPLGPGKQHLNSGVASKIVGGWQFSGIEAAYTGTPFTVTAPGSSLNAPGNIQTADQIAPVQRLGNIGTTGQFYSPASFVPVTAIRFGNTGRNILRNSGVWNTDVSVMRIFPIRERLQFQFRTEMYNLPNTSHFGSVNTGNITSNNFARITSSFGERTIRFAARMQW
jgi:hypothetical protein